MEIKFEQQGLLYVAEFEVASNCNLHIERESRGAFTIAQRGTKQGKYAYITDENYDDRTIIDVDMLGNIYPKYIKVTSTSKPTYAEVNFAEQGGGSGDDGMCYVDLRQFPHDIAHSTYSMFMSTVLIESNGNKVILPPASVFMTGQEPDAYIAGAFNKNLKISFASDSLITIKELIENEGGLPFDQLPLITEEEYYNLLNS